MKAEILVGDVRTRLAEIPDGSVQTCVTSPPYWGLRDYGQENQIGLEETPQQYVDSMVEVFREVWRVLANDGTLWLNIGDSYVGTGNKGLWKDPKYPDGRNAQSVALNNKVEGLKSKDLVGIPWRLAFALQEDGWYLRQDIIWAKPNPMPESVTDRCTKSHEYLFLLSKSNKYYFDNEAIKEPTITKDNTNRDRDSSKLNNTPGRSKSGGLKTNNYDMRNKRDVWNIPTKPFKGAHFAVMPEALVEPCILAGSRHGDLVLDPFTGSGTVAVVSLKHGRDFIGTELNPEYADIAVDRIGMGAETK
jgi:DNA modification methylase